MEAVREKVRVAREEGSRGRRNQVYEGVNRIDMPKVAMQRWSNGIVEEPAFFE